MLCACCVRAVCVRCACGAHAHAVHGPRAILPNTNTHTRLRHVGELCARPVARVGQDVVEGLVAAVLKGVNVHRAHPRLGRGGSGNGVGGWIRAEGLRLAFRASGFRLRVRERIPVSRVRDGVRAQGLGLGLRVERADVHLALLA